MLPDLPVALRRSIFADLVLEQDQGVGVRASRFAVARRHGITVDDVRRIEQEGLDLQWPPL